MIAGILVPVLSLAVIFGFIGWIRYLRHLESRAYYEALARGANPGPAERDPDAAAPPLPVPPAIRRPVWPLEAPATERDPRGLLRRGCITGAVGLALLLGLLTIGIGPWLLAGLIPLFVGLAEILFALLDRTP